LRPRLEALERRDLLASYTTPEDTPLTISDSTLAGAVVVTPPEHGRVFLANTGGFVYSPGPNYNGSDHFTYSISPPAGTSPPTITSEIDITVTPVNDPPEAHGDQFLALQNATLTIESPGVLKNDTDIDSPTLTAVLVSQAGHGTVTLKDGGGFSYVPTKDYTGPDTFTYSANDGQANSATAATVSLYVAPNTVVAHDNTYYALQNTMLTIAAPGVLGNDTGINGRPLTASLEPNSGPEHGTLQLNADGSFSYTPATGYVGADSFIYRATDVSPLANPLPPASATAKVTINVRSSAPVVLANNDVYYGLQNTALSVVAPGVLKNDYVLSGEATNSTGGGTPLNIPLNSVIVAGPDHGTLDLKADGGFSYTPTHDFSGSDTFTYRAVLTAPAGSTTPPAPNPISHDVATVTLNIKANNAPPEAHDDYYSVAQDTALNIAAPGVLGNDKGVTGHTLTAKLGDSPTHGTVTLNADGSFRYTPTAGYSGGDTFTYRAVDASVQNTNGELPTSALARVTISVRSTAPIVVAYSDIYSTLQNAALTIASPGVLKNDVALASGDNSSGTGSPINIPLAAKLVTDVTHGSLTLNADGSFTFTPEKDFTGAATFTYQAVLNQAAGAATQLPSTNSHDTATVTIYVRPINPVPVASNDSYSLLQDATLTIAAPGVLKNDVPATSYPLVSTLDHGPANGTLTLNGDGSFTYTPKPGYFGGDSFSYFDTETYVPPTTGDGPVSDPISLHSNKATVYIYVQPLHPPVYAFDDTYKTLPGATLTIAAPGVLGNDALFPPPLPLTPTGDATTGTTTPPNGPIPIPYPNLYTLTAKLLNGIDPAAGTLDFHSDGSFTFAPATGFAGAATFTYQATASAGGTTAGGVTSASTNSSGDPNFPCTINGPCPTPPDDIATVTIYVKAPEPPPGPVAVNDSFITAENTVLNIRAPGVLANDYFRFSCPPNALCTTPLTGSGTPSPINQPPSFPLTAILVTGPSNGTVTLKADGSFKYEPNADFVGTDTFTYQDSEVMPTAGGVATAADTTIPPILSNVATVTIKVVAAIAHNDQYQTAQDTTLNVIKPGVLANDSGGSAAHPLIATQLSGPLHGALTLNADGSFSYMPIAGYSGADMFTYRVSDGTTSPTTPPTGTTNATGNANGTPTSAVDVGIVRIYVRPALSGIQAHDDKFPAVENTELDIGAPGVLGNDYGPVNVPVVATLVSDVQHGVLKLKDDGSFTYTPGADFTGEDHFTYSAAPAAADSSIKGSTATVTIYVMATGGIPKVIIGGNQTATDESGPQKVTDWATVVSVGGDGQPDTFTVTTDNPHLFAAPPAIDATGQLVYTPAPNASGDANIDVVTHDEAGDTTQSFAIHIDKPHPLYNTANPYDVNNDHFVAPNDVVAVVNYLNAHSGSSTDPANGEADGMPYLDVSRDNSIAPIDALMIVNALNAGLGGGNGEAAGSDTMDAGLLTLVAQDTAEATMGRKRSG